jgi:hypothetical protein
VGITTQHITGFFIGLGAAALGFYAYKKNQDKVDEFLAKQGIKIPGRSSADLASLSLEELLLRKEHIEDLIAEKELQPGEEAGAEEAAAK